MPLTNCKKETINKMDKVNQTNIDETKQLNGEIAPIEIFFGAWLIAISLVLIAAVLAFILVSAGWNG